MSLVKCPDCGKLVATSFAMHNCKPKAGYRNDLHRLMNMDPKRFKTEPRKTYDRFTTSVCITANKPLTQKQWDTIHQRIASAIEDTIAESTKLTDQIGHVHLGSPWSSGLEICV